MNEKSGDMYKRKVGANAIKCKAMGAHLPTQWLFEPAKYPDDRADYCIERWLFSTVKLNGLVKKEIKQ